MEITNEMIKLVYYYSNRVYNNEINREDALDLIEKEIGMNRNSAGDYINNFTMMMNGKRYTRTNNTFATDYFLENILNDYGEIYLHNALQAVKKHITYYEELRDVKLREIRKLHKEYSILLNSNIVYPDDIEDDKDLKEGTKRKIVVNAYERNAKARQKCINHYGYLCTICNFDFRTNYGPIGEGFIHVHHLISLSEISENYKVNPIDDLRPVCPNCHAMLHRKKPAYTIEEILKILTEGQ
jgi:5-methylcytosine-specific restriction protein A